MSDYEPGGRRFESFRVRQNTKGPSWAFFILRYIVMLFEPPTNKPVRQIGRIADLDGL